MTDSSSGQDAFAGERTITEFWASVGQSNASNELASNVPLGLGVLVYFPAYVLKTLDVFSAPRYTLTNRRLRLDRGVRKRTESYVALDDIDEARVINLTPFTRTGDIQIVSKNEVKLLMCGVQDPEPIAKTIMDAVVARQKVQEILKKQREAKSAPAAAPASA